MPANKALVTLAAYLVACPCGMHACVVLPDGKETRHFGCRGVGQTIIKLLAEGGRIDANEFIFLKGEIEAMPYLREESLPEENVFSLEDVFSDGHVDGFGEGSGKPAERQYIM